METSAVIYHWLVIAAGTATVLAGVLYVLAWAVVKVYKMLGIWHVICLAISIRLHGKEYADRQFWWAIQERASRSQFAAKTIADYANSFAPTPTGPQPHKQG